MSQKLEKYRFNEARHLHQILVDGEYKNLTGCTTVLGVVAKPALIQWAANLGSAIGLANPLPQEIADEFKELSKDRLTPEIIKDLDSRYPVFKEARTAHCKRKTEAGSWGKETHAEVEKFISNKIAGIPSTYDPRISKFIEWVETNKVKFLATEKNIYSEKLFIGGIVDFICEIDGKRWIGDIKTSGSGIYPEHFWQCAGYDLMLQEMGEPKADGYLILNLKESGDFLEKRSISNEDNMDAFLSCLKIYRIQEKIKNQII